MPTCVLKKCKNPKYVNNAFYTGNMTAVKVQFEIGHEASIRTKKTPEGFTHDWEVFVRGQEGADISHFVDKVVFHLHETFPKPKRVVREPPFAVKESGYAGFNLPIEIYVKNKDEPKKIKFNYDLNLPQTGPATYNFLKDRYIFQNPNEDFKKKLLKGGGIIVSNNAYYTNPDQETRSRDSFTDDKLLVGKPKLSSESMKKHKTKEHKEEIPHRNSSFENLFGAPIQKPPKISPDIKKLEKSVPTIKTEKKEKDRSSSEKQKQKHEHKESKSDKIKIKDEKDKVKMDKSSKSHSKEIERVKEKSHKRPSERPPSPDVKRKCISPNRRPLSPQVRSNSASSMKEEYKLKINQENFEQKKPVKVEEKIPEIKVEKESKEKKKKEKKSHEREKERKEKKEHKKEGHKSIKELPKETVKEPPKEIPKPREIPKEKEIIKEQQQPRDKSLKLEKPFNKFSIENLRKTPQDTNERLEEIKKEKIEPERKHKHKKKDKKRDESREKHKESNKEKKHKHEKVKEVFSEKNEFVERETPVPKERPLPEPASPISLDTSSQCSSKSGIIKDLQHEVEDVNSSHSESEESVMVDEDVDVKGKIENPSPEPVKERIPTPEPVAAEPPPPPQHKEKSKKHKDKSSKREEKRRKRKAAEEEAGDRKAAKTNDMNAKTESDCGETSGVTMETKVQDNGVSSSLGEDAEPGELSPDYMDQLRELQQRIMTIKSNEELERVVNLIAETGRYEVTTQTFDFDLCLLDRSTVQQLIQLVGC